MIHSQPDFTDADWFSSSFTDGNGTQCVEVAVVRGWVGVRDTKQHGAGPILAFTPTAWEAFLLGVHADEFTS